MPSITLPTSDGKLENYKTQPRPEWPVAESFNRVAFAAAHVVANPLADNNPWANAATDSNSDPMASIDWDATLAYRNYLWNLGFAVAEAMDTAQRGMGLDWPTSLELIKRTIADAEAYGPHAQVACGAGTDHLRLTPRTTIEDIMMAYEEQCAAIEAAGGQIILMASRALATRAESADDYLRVYDYILNQVQEPVIIHWLGDMFDPALKGYWGNSDVNIAMETCMDILTTHATMIDGIKLSLLDAEQEIRMRQRLPADMHMYSGDDFNYPKLIAGDENGYSDALLGIFDGIAPAASAALGALARDDEQTYQEILEPTVPLARHIFHAPTRFYKTGLTFLAYLNDFQDHFVMLGGQQSARSAVHLAELFRLADDAGLLRDPDLAVARAGSVFTTYGITQKAPRKTRSKKTTE